MEANFQSIERRRRRQLAVAIREAELIEEVNRENFQLMELSDGSSSSSTEDEVEQVSSFESVSNPSGSGNFFLNNSFSESDNNDLSSRSSSFSDENGDVSSLSLTDFEANDSLEANIKQNLASWVVKFNVQQRKVDSLLKILALDPHNSCLPKTCRTLVKTPRKIDLIAMRPGFYYHFGLVKGIASAVKFSNHIREGDSLDIF